MKMKYFWELQEPVMMVGLIIVLVGLAVFAFGFIVLDIIGHMELPK